MPLTVPTKPQPRMDDHAHREVIDLCRNIARNGFVLLAAKQVHSLMTLDEKNLLADWEDFQNSWNRLEQDEHKKDGDPYRFRRYGVYSAEPSSRIKPERCQPDCQSLDDNTLNSEHVNRNNVLSGEPASLIDNEKNFPSPLSPFDAAIVNDEKTFHSVIPITADAPPSLLEFH